MKNFVSILALIIFSFSLLQAQDTIKVRSGWNIIGAVSTKALNQIRTEPTGIITSYYFGYSPTGYTAMDTLNKGEGYWVKANQAGLLIEQLSSQIRGTVQGTITYSGSSGTPDTNKQIVVVIYPFSNTNMQGPPNDSTIQYKISSLSPFSYSFDVPPGDYHIIAMFDANGDHNFNSGNTDPYLIFTPNSILGTGTFGVVEAKFTVYLGQTYTANISFIDTYKK